MSSFLPFSIESLFLLTNMHQGHLQQKFYWKKISHYLQNKKVFNDKKYSLDEPTPFLAQNFDLR